MRLFRCVTFLTIASLLGACAALPEAEEALSAHELLAAEARASAARAAAPPRASFTSEPDSLWLGARAVRAPTGDPLPEAYLQPDAYALTVAAGPEGEPSKARLLRSVSDLLGVSIQVDPVTLRLARQAGGGETVDDPSGAVAGGGAPGLGSAAPVSATPEGRLSDRDLAAGSFLDGPLDEDFVFRGSGASMLDRTAAILGFNSWTYQSATVWLVRHELRELPLHVLSPAGSSARLNQAVDSLRRACGGCDIESLPALGVVHVTALPAMMRRVEDWLGDLNRRLTEQFTVDVAVYAVVRDASRDFSVDFDLAFGPGVSDAFSDTRDSVTLGSGSLLRILPRGFFGKSKFEVPPTSLEARAFVEGLQHHLCDVEWRASTCHAGRYASRLDFSAAHVERW